MAASSPCGATTSTNNVPTPCGTGESCVQPANRAANASATTPVALVLVLIVLTALTCRPPNVRKANRRETTTDPRPVAPLTPPDQGAHSRGRVSQCPSPAQSGTAQLEPRCTLRKRAISCAG